MVKASWPDWVAFGGHHGSWNEALFLTLVYMTRTDDVGYHRAFIRGGTRGGWEEDFWTWFPREIALHFGAEL